MNFKHEADSCLLEVWKIYTVQGLVGQILCFLKPATLNAIGNWVRICYLGTVRATGVGIRAIAVPGRICRAKLFSSIFRNNNRGDNKSIPPGALRIGNVD